jgi:cytochrome o ubiquinol oxidase subunit 2
MVPRMRRSLDGAYTLKSLTKLLWLMASLALVLSLTGCQSHMVGLLNPKGLIAYEERKLFFDTLALMLIVVIPVIIMSLTFIYHYQVSHRTADYKPNWGHSYFLESLWWGIPCVIIGILAFMTWKSSHDMDPYKPIPGHEANVLVVQVIALPWKWLFIYPEENIATINYLEIPAGRQVQFLITVDNVPMSAFFIPQLGSQIYAMAGMQTQLHLLANEVGTYEGLNTQYNGDGFADMHFPVNVVTPDVMKTWVEGIKMSPNSLTTDTYHQLLNPSAGDKPAFYAGVQADLFMDVLHIYMNTVGTVHPRNDQLKYRYQVH